MIVGERLRELREARKMNAKELAIELGMTHTQILRYETNKSDLTSDSLSRIANFFNVSSDYLIGRADSQIPQYSKSQKTLTLDLETMLRRLPADVVGRFIQCWDYKCVIQEADGHKQLCVTIPDDPG